MTQAGSNPRPVRLNRNGQQSLEVSLLRRAVETTQCRQGKDKAPPIALLYSPVPLANSSKVHLQENNTGILASCAVPFCNNEGKFT